MTQFGSGGTQIGQSTYAYDPHGRVASVSDARNGITTYTHDTLRRPTGITTPLGTNCQQYTNLDLSASISASTTISNCFRFDPLRRLCQTSRLSPRRPCLHLSNVTLARVSGQENT